MKSGFAQTGTIRIDLENNFYTDTVPVDVRLYTPDNELVYKESLTYDESYSVDSIREGEYIFKIYIKGVPQLTIQSIKVKADSVITIPLNLSCLDPKAEPIVKKDTNKFKKRESPFTCVSGMVELFQPPFSDRKELIENSIDYSLRVGQLWNVSERYHLGWNFGGSFGFARLQRDSVAKFTGTFEKERFVDFNLSTAFVNRFILIKTSPRLKAPGCLDVCLGYNIPVMYRYEAINGNSLQTVRRISKLNGFYVMAKLGIGHIAFTGAYTLFDQIKSGFPEVPHFKFGFELYFYSQYD